MIATWILAILQAMAAIPSLIATVDSICTKVMTWWIARQTTETKQDLADALAFGARAKTQAERFQADDLWSKALSRPKSA